MFCCNILLTAILFLAKNHMTFLGLHKSKNLITLFYSLVSKAGIKSRNSSVRIVVGFFFFFTGPDQEGIGELFAQLLLVS